MQNISNIFGINLLGIQKNIILLKNSWKNGKPFGRGI